MGDTPLPLRRISTYPEETFALRIVHALREPVGGQDDRSFPTSAEYFLTGAPAIGTCPGKQWKTRCCAKALRSPYNRLRSLKPDSKRG